jgi:colicin import membrane protein
MTNEIIKISNIELELKKEFITNEQNVSAFLEKIKELKNQVFDFSTKEGIAQAKELKKEVNKSIKGLEEFCAPLEEDGKRVSKARSLITTTLKTGKDAIIDQILAPVKEREDKIKALKDKLFIPSLDSASNESKLMQINELEAYEWLAFKDEALGLITRQKEFLTNEKIKFDEQARLKREAEEKQRKEYEERIAQAAKQQALREAEEERKRIEQEKIEAENLAKKIQADLEAQEALAKIEAGKAEQRRIEAEKKAKEDAKRAAEEAINQERERERLKREADDRALAEREANIKHQAKIHNEILEDLLKVSSNKNRDEYKSIVEAIARKQIRNLNIIY